MTVECVTLETNHLFFGNPLAEQHRLRYRSITQRHDWNIPNYRQMEFDQYDTPAMTYLVWRDSNQVARGVTRVVSTTMPYMLKEHLAHLVDTNELPHDKHILEGSRFCIDHTLESEMRRQVAKELVLAYFEYSIAHDFKEVIGVMYPVFWHNLFLKYDCPVRWLGTTQLTADGKKSRAGALQISKEALKTAKNKMGINSFVISYGKDDRDVRAA